MPWQWESELVWASLQADLFDAGLADLLDQPLLLSLIVVYLLANIHSKVDAEKLNQ